MNDVVLSEEATALEWQALIHPPLTLSSCTDDAAAYTTKVISAPRL